MLFVVSSLQHILRCKIKNKNRDCKQNRYENQRILGNDIAKGTRRVEFIKHKPRRGVKNTGATTGINEVNTGVNTGAIYNLNGVRVNNMTKKGVYIVNGKKIVVK